MMAWFSFLPNLENYQEAPTQDGLHEQSGADCQSALLLLYFSEFILETLLALLAPPRAKYPHRRPLFMGALLCAVF